MDAVTNGGTIAGIKTSRSLCGFILCCLVSGVPSSVRAQNYLDVKIRDAAFETVIMNDPFLMSGLGIDVVTIEGHGRYVLSVGVTANKALKDSSPMAFLNTMKVAESNARKKFVHWVDSKVTSEASVKKEKVVIIRQTEDGIEREKRIDKVVNSWTVDEASVAVRGARAMGTWYSADRSLFYFVIAIEVP
jgi:hypothetical protein